MVPNPFIIHTSLVSSCRIESSREHLDDVVLPSRLFSVRDPMTTEEISRMGFTNVMLSFLKSWPVTSAAFWHFNLYEIIKI